MPAPADAATSACAGGLTGSTQWDEDIDAAKGTINNNCTGTGLTVAEERIELMWHGVTWDTLVTGVYHPNLTNPPARVKVWSCEASTSRTWRTKGYMKDSIGNTALKYFPSSGGTTLPCDP
jgi:hypothetical protein